MKDSNEKVAAIIDEQDIETRLRTTVSLARQAMPHENVAIRATMLLDVLEALDDIYLHTPWDGPLRERTVKTAIRVRRVLHYIAD